MDDIFAVSHESIGLKLRMENAIHKLETCLRNHYTLERIHVINTHTLLHHTRIQELTNLECMQLYVYLQSLKWKENVWLPFQLITKL